MMNCNRYRNYNTGRSGCRNEGCGGSFTEYIPVTVNYEVVFGNGFVGGDGINSGNGVSPANTGDCFYTPATESRLSGGYIKSKHLSFLQNREAASDSPPLCF